MITILPADILTAYRELTKIQDINLIHQKETRSVYHISTKTKDYCLKLIDSPNNLTFDLKVIITHLQQLPWPGNPEFLPTLSGSLMAMGNQQSALLMPWYQMGKLPRTPVHYFKLGSLIAQLHQYPGPPVNVYPASNQERMQLRKQAHTLPDPQWYLNLLDSIPVFDALPISFIHGDVGPHNALINNQGFPVIIDWELAGTGNCIWDLALPLIWMFIGRHCDLRRDNARAYYSGYQQFRSITDTEHEHLFDAALFYALKYVFYRGVDINVRRIQTALLHRNELESWTII